ncbi:MAG: O-antigen ligase family protein [Candidatus Krumholzibacteriota bacterium]
MNTHTTAAGPAPVFKSAANWQLMFLLIMLAAGYLSIAVSQIALGLALAVLLYRWVGFKEAPPVTGLEKTAALLAVWALVMIPFSTNSSQSLLYYRRFYLFAAIWVTASAATTEKRRLLMFGSMLAGALATSIYGQIHHAQLAGGFLSRRMTVLFNAMTSGALLMMAILVAVGFLIVPGIRRRVKVMISVALLPVVLGLVMTMTRSAQLGLLAGLALMLLLARPKVFGAFLGLLLLATVVLALFGENLMSERMWSRINPQYVMSGDNTSLRLEMWRGGLEMVKAHPVTGVGDRGLKEISPDYYTSEDGLYFGHLHNNIVQMAVIWGIPGLILGQAFVFAGLWFLVKKWRGLRRRKRDPALFAAQSGWVLGAIGAWVSFYIAGFTEWYFGDAESMLIYLAILGCALGPDDPGAPADR